MAEVQPKHSQIDNRCPVMCARRISPDVSVANHCRVPRYPGSQFFGTNLSVPVVCGLKIAPWTRRFNVAVVCVRPVLTTRSPYGPPRPLTPQSLVTNESAHLGCHRPTLEPPPFTCQGPLRVAIPMVVVKVETMRRRN